MMHTRYSAYPSQSLASTEVPRQDSNLRTSSPVKSEAMWAQSPNIQVPVIEKGSAVITFVQGNEVNAMDNKTYETLILPLDTEMNLEAGGEIQWMEAMGRYRITRDH